MFHVEPIGKTLLRVYIAFDKNGKILGVSLTPRQLDRFFKSKIARIEEHPVNCNLWEN
jgi:hypothetical protein